MSLITRGAHLQALREHGLSLLFNLRVRAWR
ncbi:MAG TPA: hypothetical protein VGQ26_20770 [Streptosporangiaceae bacterium]|nr:hypothetical protein [Streptosporangiaceae bacterium]